MESTCAVGAVILQKAICKEIINKLIKYISATLTCGLKNKDGPAKNYLPKIERHKFFQIERNFCEHLSRQIKSRTSVQFGAS